MKKADPYLLLAPAYLLIAGFLFYPMATVFLLSLQEYQLMDPLNTPFVGLDQYAFMLGDEYFWRSLWNSVVWVVVSLFFQFLLGFCLALLLNSARFRARGIFQAVVFAPWAVSGFLIAIIWAWLLNGEFGLVNDLLIRVGLLDQKVGFLSREETALLSCVLANIWFGVTFFAVMLFAALQAIPPSLYEAADMDGATAWQSFWRVTAPMVKPAIVITILLRAIWVFNWADLIWVMTGGGPAGASRTLALYVFQKAFLGLDFGYSAALGVALTVISLVFTAVFLRVTRFYGDEAAI
ncbi:MAG: sugar ABC transporter permease [Gemmatimonadetes bacterium]|nr:sugar ABC transporter permease [Gemmatimonadota bacterium]MYB62800.1 sugar ABC transporter permease [Gemmatimonadota bacterium]